MSVLFDKVFIIIGVFVCVIAFASGWLNSESALAKDGFLLGFLILCGGIVSRTLKVDHPSRIVGTLTNFGTLAFAVLVFWAGTDFIRSGDNSTLWLGTGGLIMFSVAVVFALVRYLKGDEL